MKNTMLQRFFHVLALPLSQSGRATALSLVCLLCAVCLSGCAGNVVTLSYPPDRCAAVQERPGTFTVCVVDFTDERTTNDIGRRLSGQVLLPRTLVARWMATGMAHELRNAGYTVIMAENPAEALTRQPKFIVTGTIKEVWLAESSLTRYHATIRASITLSDGRGQHITGNAYNSTYSTTVLPVYGVPQHLLDEALAEMLDPAVRLLRTAMQ